jgi:acetyl esterase/lipase
MSRAKSHKLIVSIVLLALATGCAGIGRRESAPAPAINGARFANADAFAPDAPSLPEGYLDVDAFREDGLLTPMRATKNIPDSVEVEYGIQYGRGGEYELFLDLYSPRGPVENAPALVFIHGGGWARHGRDYFAYWASHYAARGYVCASIDYRISDEAPFPAAVEDAKCAVRWVRANAVKLGVDADRIAVIGQSAGGHLALMAAYSSDVEELEGNGGHAGVGSSVRAVVSFYGPTDLTAPRVSREKAVRRFMGRASQKEAPDRYAAASPLQYMTQDDPPTLILHGTSDDVVPIEQSDRLAATLDAMGIPYVYDRQEGWNHAMDIFGPVNARCLYLMDRFLDEYLGQ